MTEFPLSREQHWLWQLDQQAPGRPDWLVTWAWRLHGPLDVTALRAALAAVVARQDILRTRLPLVDGQPVQHVVPELPLPLRIVAGADRPIDDWVTGELSTGFDLTTAPLWRALLVRRSPVEHALIFTWHHTVIDAWSSGILARELSACYRAELAGLPAALPPLPVRYGELAQRRRTQPDDDQTTDQLAYWRTQLADAVALELPADHPRRDRPASTGGACPFTVPGPIADRLRALAAAERVTMFMLLLAVVTTLLAGAAGQRDISIGTPLSSRADLDSEPLIGCFLNIVLLRTDLCGDPSFLELLGQVRETTLDSYEFGDLPLSRITDELGIDTVDLLRVMFIVNNANPPDWDLPGITATDHPLPEGPARHDLTIAFGGVAGEIAGHLRYRADLFTPTRIERLRDNLLTLLTAVTENPSARLSTLTRSVAAQHTSGQEAEARISPTSQGSPVRRLPASDQVG
jgi:hypothetical protein